MFVSGGNRGNLGGLGGSLNDREDRRGGSRDRRGRRDRRGVYERERERERLLEDEAVGPFASRFQSLEEMRGQVKPCLCCVTSWLCGAL